MNFPFVNLPNYFTWFLAYPFPPGSAANQKLEAFFNKFPEMNALIKQICKDIDNEDNYIKIINHLGVIGVRNRLACAFIEKAQTGKYPESVNLSLIKDVLDLESKIKFVSTDENHRAFLIGFYAKISTVTLRRITDAHRYKTLTVNQNVIDLLHVSIGKTSRVDWAILMLVQFEFFIGFDRLKRLLDNSTSYENLYVSLSKSEKEIFLNNLLTYGSSIGDSDIFIKDIVGEV